MSSLNHPNPYIFHTNVEKNVEIEEWKQKALDTTQQLSDLKMKFAGKEIGKYAWKFVLTLSISV